MVSRLDRYPDWIVLPIGALTVILVGALALAIDTLPKPWDSSLPLLFLVAFAVWSFLTQRARSRRLGGVRQRRLFQRAVLKGVVPPDAARAAWLRELDRMPDPDRQSRRYLWLFGALGGVFVAFNAVLIARDPSAARLLVTVAPVAFFVVLFVVVLRVLPNGKERATRLRTQLELSPGTTP